MCVSSEYHREIRERERERERERKETGPLSLLEINRILIAALSTEKETTITKSVGRHIEESTNQVELKQKIKEDPRWRTHLAASWTMIQTQ